jgi:hypothetical protein
MDIWRHYGRHDAQTADSQQQRYAMLAALYTGSWQVDPRWPWAGVPQALYRNARQIVKQTSAIVDLYEQLVWQGDLSTDGAPLPDGTRGAIPIDPQTGSETSDEQLLRAFSELFKIWQWRMTMSLIPKTAAIFGDVLVELVDNFPRGVVLPNIVFPGYVPDLDLELDLAGNIKRYAIEYPVNIAQSTAFGQDVAADSYTFRKEVDGLFFRYYRDDQPFDYSGAGDTLPNPYGFVPACLFRHELVVSSNRGLGAYEKTVMQAADLNSTLSSATDYQRRQFGAPIGVKGSVLRPGRTVTMPGGLTLAVGTTDADVETARRASAEQMSLLPLSDSGDFVTIQFDVGKTMEMVQFVHESLIAENPEATWASKLFGLTQATGPGMQRILAPIIGKVETVRKNHDPQMVKLLQMATSIMGYRLAAENIPESIVTARADRYEAFRPYTLDAWGRGLLDATIPGRDVFPESKAEKAQWLAIAADLPGWALRELGVDEADIAAQEAEKRAAQEQMAAALSVAGAGNEEAATSEPTAESEDSAA